jgi:hypothetical protein
MGYIHIETKNGVSVHLDNEMWVFGVLTLVFLIVTVASRSVWERSQTREKNIIENAAMYEIV